MRLFEPGDKVTSDKYGPGTVVCDSCTYMGVRVDFTGGPYDCVYHAVSGQRLPACGSDVITLADD